jgi:type II secretory pathway component PulM
VNRLQDLLANVEAYLQKISQRERLMLAASVGGVLLLIVFFSTWSFSKAVTRREGIIASKTKALHDIGQLAGTYSERTRARQQMEQRLKAKVALFTFIDDVSKKEHIDIGDMQDRGNTVGQDKVTESVVELDLNKITLDKLTTFLNALEHDPHLIRVKKIRVRGRIDDPNQVDASMTVSAYSMGAT